MEYLNWELKFIYTSKLSKLFHDKKKSKTRYASLLPSSTAVKIKNL